MSYKDLMNIFNTLPGPAWWILRTGAATECAAWGHVV